ncbi:MAG TPA: hypothetical protein VF681_08895 [Abditibacteriaceae bacterium]|jgi:hypothetical protein
MDNSTFVSQSSTAGPTGRFSHQNYVISRKLMKLIGGTFFVHDPSGQLVLYASLKAFKLKEDITLYTGEDKTEAVLTIKARSILDFGATYDVTDAKSGQSVGALRRKGWQSFIQDEWAILDPQDRELGTIKEDSTILALIRRFIEYVSFFLPQKFNAEIGGRPVALFTQKKNPFSSKLEVDFSADTSNLFDRRLALAAGILLCAIEGRQSA